ncbi:hypothetical protein HD554DRAFT_2183223 [Boletus coccyginus]|nr:hypothetical protein HD554DRAFT_2183223 [Boletus coccyginus]
MSPLSRWLLVLVAFFSLLWITTRPPPHRPLPQAPLVDDHSLTVILPVVQSTLASLDRLLAPFLASTAILFEVAIVCPRALVSDTHRKLHTVLWNATHGHPKVSLYPWSGHMHHHQASLDVITRVKTQWILLLDEHGFEQVAECDRAYLLHPRAVHLPVGPRGFSGSSHNWSQLEPSDRVQPAAFLVPPFVAPSILLAGAPPTSHLSLVWPALGTYVAKSTLGSFGGVILVACNDTTFPDEKSHDDSDSRTLADPGSLPPKGFFVLAFPRKQDLRNFIPATCKLHHQGYTVFAYLYDTFDEAGFSGVVIERNCTVPYFQRSKEIPGLSAWLDSLGSVPDVVIGLDHQDFVSSTLSSVLEQTPFLNTTLIRLPRRELPYTEWIGTLTLHELRHWNVPEIILSVITNNRPHSLQRLLESIQRTLFYGDKVNIRINMDQNSDPETMHIVHDFEWPHGDVFLHHRVIHGGLLSAVVESWYPHCNDSYGLLLEDDIELSPLSYAWVKMTLLRYKYGESSPSSSKLFGISLYQQKIIELRPTGRQPFNARTLFQSLSLADFSAPYLSQIPCSWGALYFPSPWREFHDYVTLRLSQFALPIGSTIVPGVRSNKWSKSWKKYFIELVYLRGYVMLYPNYADFVSLSTNHLEVGSHVRDAPEEVYERRKRLFSLPLMHLSGALAGVDDGAHGPRLLDLPGGTLPDLDRLPVLDLVGEVSSMEAIQRRGDERRTEFGACLDVVAALPSSVRDLLCHVPL